LCAFGFPHFPGVFFWHFVTGALPHKGLRRRNAGESLFWITSDTRQKRGRKAVGYGAACPPSLRFAGSTKQGGRKAERTGILIQYQILHVQKHRKFQGISAALKSPCYDRATEREKNDHEITTCDELRLEKPKLEPSSVSGSISIRMDFLAVGILR
jgi:hypothetical protein